MHDFDDWMEVENNKRLAKRIGEVVPAVTFKTRVRDEHVGGSNPYRWEDVNSYELFGGKRVIIFSLPGAFTPTCDTFQLPDFDFMYDKFRKNGIDEIYCISVNDAFVMNAWANSQSLRNVKMIPDGSGTFTNKMGMLVSKNNLGFGDRSWRYAAIVNNGIIEAWFEEPGFKNDAEDDPYSVSSPGNIMKFLENSN
jgi:alkyl hydroperoxide reductase subunit AhpC